MTAALVCIGAFGLLRVAGPSAWLVVALTVGVGIGMGLGTAIAPIAVREHLPGQTAIGMGVYAAGVQIGSTTSATLAVPLALALAGWRGALGAFSVAACALLVGWVLLTRGSAPHTRAEGLPHLPWRSITAWLLVVVFALMGCAYYGLNAWLPDAYVERGWSDHSAGLLLAMMNLTAIPASLGVPWLSARFFGRRAWLIGLSLVFFVAAVGLVTLPAGAYAWVLLSGIGQGGMFALTMALPLDLEDDPQRMGGLVGMMLGLGYTLAALAPFVLGGVRDATGSFDAVLWAVAGFLGLLVLSAVALARVAGHRHPATQPAPATR
jgi:CP family cyanate transporter-like MFS transporter